MQGLNQDTSLLAATLLQGQGGVPASSAPSQLSETSNENGLTPFLASLRQTLQTLIDNGQLTASGADTATAADAVEQLLAGQAATNGPHLPVAQGQALAVGSEALVPNFVLDHGQALLGNPESLLTSHATQIGLDGAGVSPQPNAVSAETLLAQIKLATAGREMQPQLTPLSPPAGLDSATAMQHDVMDRRLLERFGATAVSAHAVDDEITLAAKQNATLALRQDMTAALQSQPELLRDADNPQLLEGGSLLRQETAERISPVLLERMLMGMAKEQRTNPEAQSWNNSQLDPIASLQSGQMNRNVGAGGGIEARPTQGFIQTPLTDPQWQTDFSNRVFMFAKGTTPGQPQVAEIRLNPAHMGAIEVRVVMNDDQASVTFASQHGTVREAIETSLPRLRDMFNSAGLMLSDAEVSDQSLHQHRQNEDQHAANGQHDPSESGFILGEESEQLIKQIDLYGLPSSSSLDLYA